MTRHFDYLAIGGGSGGIASINRAAMYGQKCALIEAKELGGTCVNVGCVPKKVMWLAAELAGALEQAAAAGFVVPPSASAVTSAGLWLRHHRESLRLGHTGEKPQRLHRSHPQLL